MIKVNTHEAKTRLSSLLARVEKQAEIITICRNGEPIAELHPVVAQNPLRSHPKLSKVKFLGDPMAPLDVEDWPEPQ